jgi:hypothetical protein
VFREVGLNLDLLIVSFLKRSLIQYRYDRHATMHALRGVRNFCMCLRPGCNSGQVHASGNGQPIMTCNVCHFKTCFTHQMPWHEGMTCLDYDQTHRRQNEENEASLALLRNVGLICPSCSLPGIKVSGCDHMTCTSLSCPPKILSQLILLLRSSVLLSVLLSLLGFIRDDPNRRQHGTQAKLSIPQQQTSI